MSIFITGSRHSVMWWQKNLIQIGCKNYSISEWENNFKSIGLDQGYSEDQIVEYGNYIQMIKTLQSQVK